MTYAPYLYGPRARSRRAPMHTTPGLTVPCSAEAHAPHSAAGKPKPGDAQRAAVTQCREASAAVAAGAAAQGLATRSVSLRSAATALCAVIVGATALPAQAASYPDRPIRFIVPYAPGGGPDVQARRTADAVAKELGGNVVVENKVGAGGMLAGEFVSRAPADGYTVMLGASTLVVQKILQPSLGFDPVEDFTQIVRTGYSPQVLVVRSDSPYTDVKALIEAARTAKDPLNYGSGGIGSAAHLAGAAFSSSAGVKTIHIPYRGSVEIVPALLRGDTSFAFPTASTALPHVTDGKVRALAVTSAKRLAQLPDVPTLNEIFQRDDLALDSWSGMWAPKGLPDDVTTTLEAAFKKVYAQPEIAGFYAQSGTLIDTSASPAAFKDFVRQETEKYARIIRDNKIEVDQ